MNNFLDRVIIKQRREQRKRECQTIETGMYAGDQLITFSKTNMFDNHFSICLPDSFIDMPEEYINAKYILEECPQVIKTEGTGEIVFSFQMVNYPLAASDVEAEAEQIKKLLKRIFPFHIFMENGVLSKDSEYVAWIDYKSFGIDQPLYQYLYITSVKGQMMLGMFHCPFREMNSWKTIIIKIMETIHTEKTETS